MVIATSNKTLIRLGIHITGTVQGVGFRPHVYRLATQLSLTGFVMNDGSGVYIEVQGNKAQDFLQQLQLNFPPLAKIKTIHQKSKPLILYEKQFIIRSTAKNNIMTNVGSDSAICKECIQDLFDKNSHYFHYPFITCTHCGPRYTITRQLPFDRENTSMTSFALCDTCQIDYHDPNNRRFHAQAIACAKCGPALSHSIEMIANAIQAGEIIAIKSLGGYQLLCDAYNEDAIKKLRKNKKRKEKPFAIMVLNEQSALQYVQASKKEMDLLSSYQRPIVICSLQKNNLPQEISPNLSTLGIMLPYTPLHYLIFEKLNNAEDDAQWLIKKNDIALIVTSANDFDTPMLTDDILVKTQLNNTMNCIVSYNRDIITHVDDSIVRCANEKTFFIRRARGYTLEPIELPHTIPSTLALGGFLKNTICITRQNEAFISQHIGTLSNVNTIKVYHDTITHMLKLLNIKPACLVRDYHPNFYSSHFAEQFHLPIFSVQHHHAHLAAMAAQNKLTQPALGLALDGFGLGDQQESWGGELMLYQTTNFIRLGHLQPSPQPGGEITVKQPWRMAASILFQLNQLTEIEKRFSSYQSSSLMQLLQKNIYSPLSSSCGRLFDAASALLNLCHISTYEGQAAMMLESKVTSPTIAWDGWQISENQLNLLPLFEKILTCNQIEGANLFHGTLAAALSAWIFANTVKHGITHIILAGGCFLNRVLLELMQSTLQRLDLTPVFPDFAMPNDAGLSLGQAWIAGNKMMEC